MFEVPCPKCRGLLAFEEQDARRKTKCPLCRQRFTVPQPPPPTTGNWRTFAIWCAVLALVAVLWLAWIIGIGWTLLFLICLGAIFASSPFGGSFIANALKRQQRKGKRAAIPTIEQPPTILKVAALESASLPQPRVAAPFVESTPSHQTVQTMATDDLVEIQPAARALPATQLTPRPIHDTQVTPPPVARPRPLSAPLSRVEFLGPDSVVELDRGTLFGPLIYMTQGTLREPGDPSVVELGLPVGRSGIIPGQEPPTWPTYRSFNASQRSFYLQWLIAGRRQNVPLPYVTLFLYGLERRVLVDAQDHDAVAQELIGLLQAYGSHYPFRRDVAALLWLTIELSCQIQPVVRQTVDAAIERTQEWTEQLLRHCLTTFATLRWSVPAELARKVAAEDSRTVNSVVISRHADMFRTLFEQRMTTHFPNGLILQIAGRPEKIDYLIINPSLTRLPRSEISLTARPRVPATAPEIDQLVDFWERGVADLKVYDRVHRSAESGPLTAEMWEALPEISRQYDEHPESDAWHALLQQAFQKHGRPLVAISDLAQIKQIEQRGRLTKKQSEQLVTTAAYLQLAIEPDARLTGKTYAWDDVVAVFPRRDATAEDLATYQAAATLLRLGMNIAAADGDIDETELSRITSHLDQQFELSPTAADRLEHLRYALIHSPASRGQVEKALREKLLPEQRQIVGEFLVGIAVADGTISPAELKALKKAWQALGLEARSLEALLQQPESETAASGHPLVLDQDRISQIMLDTQRVAEMLKAAMSVDEGSSESIPIQRPKAQLSPVSEVSPPTIAAPVTPHAAPITATVGKPASTNALITDWEGLAPRYHEFLRHLLTRSIWPRRDLDSYARSHKLMLGGALEAINEWTHEIHGDWLISEEGDEIHVQQNLLSMNK